MATAVGTSKDSYSFQRARIIRICDELAPGSEVQFDETTSDLRFQVRQGHLGIKLTESSGHRDPSELADKSDEWVRAFIIQLSNGKIG